MVGHGDAAAPGQNYRRQARCVGAVGGDYRAGANTIVKILSRGQRSEIRGQRSKAEGAALMLALWALFLLSALVISWALDIDSRLTLSGNANRVLEAEALACSGAEVALHPLIKLDSPNLNRRINSRENY